MNCLWRRRFSDVFLVEKSFGNLRAVTPFLPLILGKTKRA